MRGLSNESHSLGEPISNASLVKKILRSLPERLKIKVTTIDEVHTTSQMKVDELIGSLLMYEISLKADQPYKNPKCFAFKVTNYEPISQSSEVFNESYEDSVALLAKNFGRIMRRL